jgi:hypothetical protein
LSMETVPDERGMEIGATSGAASCLDDAPERRKQAPANVMARLDQAIQI